ncbi:hypothetical protein ACJMK2_003023 [Sinanodonta woodiana]|uniref:G-protein coupled receptors family 1 profile domain-containing protein n=1 Tax=Sinanodonta woodiana TaxID=1069815 RepID=A0ABD3XYU7_SINWO
MFTPLKDISPDRNWTLDELNDKEVQLLVPVIVFIAVAMVIGLVGNILVLKVNSRIIKVGNCTYRYFIIMLASVDIIFCLIGDPFIIGVLTHPYNFTNTLACKCLRTFSNFNVLVSSLVLSVIALDRYKRICRPEGHQFSERTIKYIFGIIVCISLVFSIPTFILYGRNTVQTGYANITGIQCFPDDIYKDTLFPNVYTMFLGTMFIILTASISVFYILIWRKVKIHVQSMKTSVLQRSAQQKVKCIKMETKSTETYTIKTMSQIQNTMPGVRQILCEPEKNESKENKRNKELYMAERAKTIRVSKMLFVVTAFFVLSFAPFIALELLTFFDEYFIENLDNTSTMFYQLFWRTFSINFMVNPFIYGVMDKRFRMECKNLCVKRASLGEF